LYFFKYKYLFITLFLHIFAKYSICVSHIDGYTSNKRVHNQNRFNKNKCLLTMAKIKIKGSGDKYDGMYVKSIDKVNTKLEFTDDASQAYQRSGGYYINAEIDYLKFYFSEEYPCLEYAREEGY